MRHTTFNFSFRAIPLARRQGGPMGAALAFPSIRPACPDGATVMASFALTISAARDLRGNGRKAPPTGVYPYG